MANKEKAASKKVTVELKPGLIIELDTNSPDVDKFIADIVANKETINPANIKVECDDEKFDCESFCEIVQKTVEDLIEDITIEEAAVKAAQGWIAQRNASNAEEEDSQASGAGASESE